MSAVRTKKGRKQVSQSKIGTVVYRGIKISPVSGKRSSTANELRTALFKYRNLDGKISLPESKGDVSEVSEPKSGINGSSHT